MRKIKYVIGALAIVAAAVGAALVTGNSPPDPKLPPAPRSAVIAAAATPLSITIHGNKWVNGSGQEVVLKGANTEGTQYDCAQSGAGFFDDSTISGTNFTTEINALKAWGINIVRVNLNEECWLGINGVPGSTSVLGSNGFNAYANEMGAYVTALNAAGIYAEVDLHLNAPGSELISDAGNADGQNPLPEAHSDAFWKSVGTFFKGNPAVIFGVFNEPFPTSYQNSLDSEQGWLDDANGATVSDCTTANGGSSNPKCSSATYAGEGMKQMIIDIRSVDTTTPLLVGGPDFASDMDQWLATFQTADPDNLIAASVHIYYPNGNTTCGNTTSVATACSGDVASVAKQVPVLIDELGDFGCSATSLTPFLTSVDALNTSASDDVGWVGWSWTTVGCDPTLISSFSTGKPATMGVPFYCNLFLNGLNNGSLTTCPGTPTSTTTTTVPPSTTTTQVKPPPPTTTTTVIKPPPTTTTTVKVPPTTTTTVRRPPPTTTTTVQRCKKHHKRCRSNR